MPHANYQLLESVGEYALLLKRVLTLPDRFSQFLKEFLKGVYALGVNSIWIVVIISFFIGAVIVLQIAVNIDSMLPRLQWGWSRVRSFCWSSLPPSCA